jgi:hypothetical protein
MASVFNLSEDETRECLQWKHQANVLQDYSTSSDGEEYSLIDHISSARCEYIGVSAFENTNIVASINIDTFDEYKLSQKMETMPIERGFRVIITDSQTKVYYDSFNEESYLGKLFVYEPITDVLVNRL